MTLRQYRSALKAIDKRIRMMSYDMYQDEVTPEGELYILGKTLGGR